MATSYPPVGFHFKISFANQQLSDGNISFIHAQEVKGLSATIETGDTIKEGGENTFVHKLPGRVTYSPITIVRGMVSGSAFVEWAKKAVERYQFEPVDLLITLLDEQHQPLEYWYVVNAYPAKVSTSDFNAQDNKIVIETLELNYQFFQRGDASGQKTVGAGN